MKRGEDSKDHLPPWRIKDRLLRLGSPLVMGIINATPDSFHAASRTAGDAVLRMAENMLGNGAAILDIGGASSRPGAAPIEAQEEMDRLLPLVHTIHQEFPHALISVDTYRAAVASEAVKAGAGMVNDISAGSMDVDMLSTVAALHVPYVLMHMQGVPATMQRAPHYDDVVREVVLFLSQRLHAARAAGIPDVIVDPGFGFGKTTAHNFKLLAALPAIAALGVPVLAGLSRKRMINEVLGTTPAEALNGTTVLHAMALAKGAHILRTHDVKEAVQCIRLFRFARENR